MSETEPLCVGNQLQNIFAPTDSKLAMKLFGSKKALMKERVRQKEIGHWIIHPCSSFRFPYISKNANKCLKDHKYLGFERTHNIDSPNNTDLAIFTIVVIKIAPIQRFYWDLCMLLLLVANLIILPVAISFFNDDLSMRWVIFNCVSDTIFLIDIVVNFRTGEYLGQPWRAARHAKSVKVSTSALLVQKN